MTSVYALKVVSTTLQHASNICVPNNASIGIFRLHSDFRFEFVM